MPNNDPTVAQDELIKVLADKYNEAYADDVRAAKPLTVKGKVYEVRPTILAYACYQKEIGKDLRVIILNLLREVNWEDLSVAVSFIINAHIEDDPIRIKNWTTHDCEYVFFVAAYDLLAAQKKTIFSDKASPAKE